MLDALNAPSRQEEKVNGIQTGKKDLRLSVFAGDMIQYIKTINIPLKKLLELLSEFSKAAEYKINIQKLVPSLSANNKLSGREIKKIVLFTIA